MCVWGEGVLRPPPPPSKPSPALNRAPSSGGYPTGLRPAAAFPALPPALPILNALHKVVLIQRLP